MSKRETIRQLTGSSDPAVCFPVFERGNQRVFFEYPFKIGDALKAQTFASSVMLMEVSKSSAAGLPDAAQIDVLHYGQSAASLKIRLR